MNESNIIKIFEFLILLIKWNEKFNLISVNHLHELFINHVIDSISILEHYPFQHNKICDIGTGAGFPGVILAILKPDNQYYFFEPEKKYFLFLKKVIQELHLNNIVLINQKIEYYQKSEDLKFDLICNRAVGDINHIIKISRDFTSSDTIFFFFKGERVFQELQQTSLSDFLILMIKKVKILEIHSKNHYIIAIKK